MTDIAKDFSINNQTVANILKSAKLPKIEFSPFLYNIWNSPKDNAMAHFGMLWKSYKEINILKCFVQILNTATINLLKEHLKFLVFPTIVWVKPDKMIVSGERRWGVNKEHIQNGVILLGLIIFV